MRGDRQLIPNRRLGHRGISASIGEISAQIQRTGRVVADAARGTRDADTKINRLAAGHFSGRGGHVDPGNCRANEPFDLRPTIEAAQAVKQARLCRRCRRGEEPRGQDRPDCTGNSARSRSNVGDDSGCRWRNPGDQFDHAGG